MQPQLPTTRLPQGTSIVNAKAMNRGTKYDTVRFAGTAAGFKFPNPIRLFVNPLGRRPGTVGGLIDGFTIKTPSQTNMEESGQIEYPNMLTVDSIVQSVTPVGAAALTDTVAKIIRALLEDSILTIFVDDNKEIEDHLIMFPGVGLTGLPRMSGAVAETYISSATIQRDQRVLNPTIPIQSRVPFKVEINWNEQNALLAGGLLLGQDIEFCTYLFGLYTRTVD